MDGSFSIESFDPDCNRIRFTASKAEEFWLKTGDDVFYAQPLGTAPGVELRQGVPPSPITIVLGELGGRIEFRVWDEAIQSLIPAGLEITRKPVGNKVLTALYTAIKNPADSLSRLLPVGLYEVRLNYFDCRGKTYFPRDFPGQPFEIVAEKVERFQLKVNTAELETRSSYANPRAEKCRP